MIKQIPSQQFASECGKAVIVVSNDMPLGVFHDFLLNVKGEMVDRMIKAQKDEEKQAKFQTEIDEQTPKEC